MTCQSSRASMTLLEPGRTFNGTQRLSSDTPDAEAWNVNIVFEELRLKDGYIAGRMSASNIPGCSEPVVSFFEGEIVDCVNHHFSTDERWNTNLDIDLRHWLRFPSFGEIAPKVIEGRLSEINLDEGNCVYWRLKEQFFISYDSTANLTIAGFYYMCFDRTNDTLTGYYFDPHSQPFQKLSLKWDGCTSLGTYEFR